MMDVPLPTPGAKTLPTTREDERLGGLFWSVVAALMASGAYLLARYIHLGPNPEHGPWAYWPINGILCGLLFRRPRREWAALALAAIVGQGFTIALLLGNLARGTVVVGGVGTALEALLGAWFLRRRHAPGLPLGSARSLAEFVVVVVCLVPLGVTALSALGFAAGLGRPHFDAWWPLFVGDSLSMLIFAPLFMQRWWHWREEASTWSASRLEVALCQASILLLAVVTFAGIPLWSQYVVLPYLMLPLFVWTAMRCGPKWMAVSILSVTTVSAWFTSRGMGPFVPMKLGLDETVVGLQSYHAFVGLTGLLLAALTEQHRRAYAELALQGAIQRAFVESSDAPFILKDLTGRYVLVNRAAEALLGHPREELIGHRPPELLARDVADVIDAHDRRVAERGEPLTFEETFRTNGTRRTLLVTRFPVRDAAGVLRYVGMVARDETLDRELTHRLDRAQRVELLGQLAAGLAHDLNNLLSIIVNNAALLRARRGLPPDEAEMLRDMSDASERAAALTGRLLTFGRRQAAPRERHVVADDALRALEPLLRALARGGVDVVGRYGAPGAVVLADPSELEQVVLNLVSNARDAIGGEGQITLGTEFALQPDHGPDERAPDVRRWWRLRVSDTGAGMDEPTLARLFQPFFSTKPDAKSTGLGLYTTALLVRQLGGDIHATSAPGRGSTFVVDLPVEERPAPA